MTRTCTHKSSLRVRLARCLIQPRRTFDVSEELVRATSRPLRTALTAKDGAHRELSPALLLAGLIGQGLACRAVVKQRGLSICIDLAMAPSTVDWQVIVAHCIHFGLLAMQELYGASFCIPPHPKIVEANRIKDANLIFPETSSRLK
jgi:hypothetical protein